MYYKSKIPVLFFVFLAGFLISVKLTNAQEKEISKKSRTEYILRGKAFSSFIVEDVWISSVSLGMEVKFADRFSIVADAVYSRWKFEKEVYIGTNYEEYNEYSKYDTRNYLAFELRYYPKLNWVSYQWKWYFNVFSKIGQRIVHVQNNYPKDEGEIYRIRGTFNDLGLSLGVQVGRRFGFDFNAGAALRTESRTEEVYHDQAPFSLNEINKEQRWIGNVRLHLYYNLSRKQSKTWL